MGKKRRKAGCRPTPLGAVLRGLVAGAAGTAVMDFTQYLQYRAGGGTAAPLEWELAGVDGWDSAPAPAQVGRRLYEGLFQTELPPEQANRVNNVVHWSYGLAWGAVFGVVAGSASTVRLRWGPLLGTAVWLVDYATLPPTGLYRPMGEYDRATLAKDWLVHAAYGTGAAAALRLTTRSGPGDAPGAAH